MIERLVTLFAGGVDIDTSPLPDTAAGTGTLQDVFNVVFAVTAAIAVLIIVIAGIKFIWSRGDAQATAKARSAIIYAAMGLAIMAVAFSIVSLVLNVLGG